MSTSDEFDAGYNEGYDEAEQDAKKVWQSQVEELTTEVDNLRNALEEARSTLRNVVYDIENAL